ncbi:hypothetical protein ACFLZH_01905 [Patescibacteria group bacterium]
MAKRIETIDDITDEEWEVLADSPNDPGMLYHGVTILLERPVCVLDLNEFAAELERRVIEIRQASQ